MQEMKKTFDLPIRLVVYMSGGLAIAVMLCSKEQDKWVWWTYGHYDKRVDLSGVAFAIDET